MAQLNGMQGNEIADDFIRKGGSGGRWKDTWSVVKGNFWKLVALNLIVLIFFVPGIVVMYFRGVYIAGLGSVYPFNATAGNFPPEGLVGLGERLTISTDLLFYALLLAAGLIASVGVSGATYCIRKLLQTHGQFQFKSFFHGIKVCYFSTMLPVLVFLLGLYSATLIGDWKDIVGATGGNFAGAMTAYVFVIIFAVLLGIYLAWIYAIGVSYRVKFRYLLRNAFVIILGTPIQTVFMAGFSLIPVWFLLMGGIMKMIGYVLFIFLGFSFIMVCWLSFTQWAFDLYITPAIKTEKEAARAQKTEKELAAEKAEEDRQRALELLAAGKSELIARPIMPIGKEQSVRVLGKTFTRDSLSGAYSEREKLAKDVDDYRKAHENDPVYVEYNKMFEEREKALQEPETKKGKKSKSKISSDNLLR